MVLYQVHFGRRANRSAFGVSPGISLAPEAGRLQSQRKQVTERVLREPGAGVEGNSRESPYQKRQPLSRDGSAGRRRGESATLDVDNAK